MDNPSDSGIARLPDQKVPPQSMLWRPAVEVKKIRGRPRRSEQCRGAARSADARRPLHVREVAQQQPPGKRAYQIARPVERSPPDRTACANVIAPVHTRTMAAASAFTTRSTLKYLLGNGTPGGGWDNSSLGKGILHGGPLNQPAAPLEGERSPGGPRLCGAAWGQAGGEPLRSRPQDHSGLAQARARGRRGGPGSTLPHVSSTRLRDLAATIPRGVYLPWSGAMPAICRLERAGVK